MTSADTMAALAAAGLNRSVVTCLGAPWQVEGYLVDGRVFYFRARHGRWQLGVADTRDMAVCNAMMIDAENDPVRSAGGEDVEDMDERAAACFVAAQLRALGVEPA